MRLQPKDHRREMPGVHQLTSERHPQSPTEGKSEFLTAKDLEIMLQIDRKTIYGYVRDELIPYVRIQSNLRFRRQEITAWIEQQSYRPRRANNGDKTR